MTTPEAIRIRANDLRDMAASNRIDAAQEDVRGNVVLARNLRERADDYDRLARELLAKIGEAAASVASIGLVFAALYGLWCVTP